MGFSRQECWSGVPLPSASQEHWQPSNSMSNNRLQGFEIEHKGFLLRFEEACHSRINLAECHLSPSVCVACFQGEQVPVQCSCACFRSAGTDGAFTRQLQKELAGGIGTRGFYPTAAEGAGWRDRNQVAALVPTCLCSASSEPGHCLSLIGHLSQDAMGQGS